MFRYPKTYDVIVIGAGHAGVEAAMAAARLGAEVAVLTQNLDTIGQMSCNPAIGGLAKGHMVREIDALGGAMALNTDATAIQFRMLNASKGPSVRAPRAQCDKKAYQFRMKHELESMKGIDIHQGNVADILETGDRVTGVSTSLGMEICGKTVILSAGTFMGGLMHVGLKNEKGGRMFLNHSNDSVSMSNASRPEPHADSMGAPSISPNASARTATSLRRSSATSPTPSSGGLTTFLPLIPGVSRCSTWNKCRVG